MIVLALETSCDETAAAVVRDGVDVLSSVVASQYDLHAEYAGVVPEIASRAHVEAILPVVREALEHAGVGLGMVDAIAVGTRPGLIGSLLVGVAAAKSLAWSLGKPLIGVDHVAAHVYSGMLESRDPAMFPALGLVVSGGHTAMYHVASWTQMHRVGATIDDAMGEAYDKVATMMKLPHPGGPNLDQLASDARANDKVFDLPISRLSTTSLDFSFSGLKTSVLYTLRGVPRERGGTSGIALTDETSRDLAASFQRAACKAVTIKLTRAIEQAREKGVAYRSLLCGGGVTANSRLRRELLGFEKSHGLVVRLPAMRYCMDNAAMIGGLGEQLLRSGRRDDMSLQATPTISIPAVQQGA
jgi:N6-L-threonylcarbamoyladenine synthase